MDLQDFLKWQKNIEKILWKTNFLQYLSNLFKIPIYRNLVVSLSEIFGEKKDIYEEPQNRSKFTLFTMKCY